MIAVDLDSESELESLMLEERAESQTEEECGSDSPTTGGCSEGGMTPGTEAAADPQKKRRKSAIVSSDFTDSESDPDAFASDSEAKGNRAPNGDKAKCMLPWRPQFRFANLRLRQLPSGTDLEVMTLLGWDAARALGRAARRWWKAFRECCASVRSQPSSLARRWFTARRDTSVPEWAIREYLLARRASASRTEREAVF